MEESHGVPGLSQGRGSGGVSVSEDIPVVSIGHLARASVGRCSVTDSCRHAHCHGCTLHRHIYVIISIPSQVADGIIP